MSKRSIHAVCEHCEEVFRSKWLKNGRARQGAGKLSGGFVLVMVLVITLVLAVISTALLRQAVLAQRMVTDQHEQVQLTAALWQGLEQTEQSMLPADDLGSSVACGELPCSNQQLLSSPQVRWTAVPGVELPADWQIASTVQLLRRLPLQGKVKDDELLWLQITVRTGPLLNPNQGVLQAVWLAYQGPSPVPAGIKLGEQSRWRLR